MRCIFLGVAGMLASACAAPPQTTSAGDDPVHEIHCPGFLPWKVCLQRGERLCAPAGYRLLYPDEELLDRRWSVNNSDAGDKSLIDYTITILCDD